MTDLSSLTRRQILITIINKMAADLFLFTIPDTAVPMKKLLEGITYQLTVFQGGKEECATLGNAFSQDVFFATWIVYIQEETMDLAMRIKMINLIKPSRF